MVNRITLLLLPPATARRRADEEGKVQVRLKFRAGERGPMHALYGEFGLARGAGRVLLVGERANCKSGYPQGPAAE